MILGLLVGGVLAGKSLIRAAGLQSVVKEYDHYRTSALTFKTKYLALPGDMPNATQFWGQAAASGITCFMFSSTDKKTCDGNGDGLIYPFVTGTAGSAEPARALQHMANADIIPGKYDGANDYGVGKIGRWVYGYTGSVSGSSYRFNGEYGHSLTFTGKTASNSYILTPIEGWSIDNKIDDGKPATGKVAHTSPVVTLDQCTDTASNTNLSANYLLDGSSTRCSLIFRNQF